MTGLSRMGLIKGENMGARASEVAKCDTCTYQSTRFKLYQEVKMPKRERKAAKMNIGVQAA